MSSESKAAVLTLIGVVIGVAIFAGTVIFAWANRSDATIRRANWFGIRIASAFGLLGLLQWFVLAKEPVFPYGLITAFVFFMVPAYVLAFHVRLAWLRRSEDSSDYRGGVS